MAISVLTVLLSGISQFSLLSPNDVANTELAQRYCLKIVKILNISKPVLEEILVSEIPLDEQITRVLEELDALFNDARELAESWQQMSSKLYFVLHIEHAITKIRACVLETCQLVSPIFESLPAKSHLACVEGCLQEIQDMVYESISDSIKGAMKDQMENVVPDSEHLVKIADSLSLSSNQELLMEAVALEKLKTKVSQGENHGELEYIDAIIALINHMHDCYVRVNQLHSINGIPIPPDFCCPLSLELMSDPVIVACGQTYERAFIRKWLDEGFTVCPKTRQTLGHTNLIPNYNVKALIANWCESNNIKLPDPKKTMSLSQPSAFVAHTDLNSDDSNNPRFGHPRNVHPRSPESNRSVMSSSNKTHMPNENNQDGHMNDKPKSPHLSNGIEASIARISQASVDGNGSSLDEQHSGSHGQASDQSNEGSNSGKQLQGHNRASSASSAVSSTEFLRGAEDARVSRASSDLTHYGSDASGEMTQDAPASSDSQREPELQSRLPEPRSRSQTMWRRPSERFVPRIISSPSMDTRQDLSGVETEVRRLLEDLKSDSIDFQRNATHELRLLAKHNMENRIVIANCGAISHLVGLLHSTDPKTQENAVTALLNLSINDNNKMAIANADAIDPLIYVLEMGNPEAKENSAATLFSLSVIEENKVKIGRSGAVIPLVELLGNGTPRGKKDAATALFNLSIFHENKLRIVQAGAVRHLVELMDPAAGMVDKAVAVLANLATIQEGRTAIGHEGGIPALVEVVELGSGRGKENAAAALLHLCTNSNRFCSMVLQEGAVPPLVALSQSGTPRAKEKAQLLLSHFRSQRHGSAGRS
uniref:RING-type E3 ubiquitin transferase n=1 Tax=Anthurium amnicola TaxID=1678845 RepID=A0A1D1XMR3_9ARAE